MSFGSTSIQHTANLKKKQQAPEKGIDILGFADVLAAEFIGKYDCGEDKAGRKILRDLAEAAEVTNVSAAYVYPVTASAVFAGFVVVMAALF